MGVSTNGTICFGISFEEGFEFPWDETHNGDIDEWWLDMNGYKNPFELYDESGEYLNGIEPSKEQISEYYDKRNTFLKENPIPVELEMHCSGDYPMWFLAVKKTILTARRGYPEEFKPEDLIVSDKDIMALIDFCEKYEIEHEEPKWYLSSLWS